MQRQQSKLLMITAAAAAVLLVTAGCEAKVYGTPPVPTGGPQLIVVAPQGASAPLPEAAPDEPPMAFTGLDLREKQATADAAKKGADITVAVLDRNTGQLVANGSGGVPIASVVKLFIADDLLLQVSKGQTQLSPADREAFDRMLRQSDDGPAEVFWNRSGGSAIINRVVARYGLSSTRAPSNGRWFNTMSTVMDLVHYYDMMLAGTGGLPPEQASIILANLAASAPVALDNMMPGGVYPQRFGIPDGLAGESFAVKQGWMCCIGSEWMHLSTGVIGPDRRYVMAISSMQSTSPEAARGTITEAVKTMFPGGL